MFGDSPTDNHLRILFNQNRLFKPSTHLVKHFLGSKPPNIVMSMLMYDNRSNINSSNSHYSEHHRVKRAPFRANEYWTILRDSLEKIPKILPPKTSQSSRFTFWTAESIVGLKYIAIACKALHQSWANPVQSQLRRVSQSYTIQWILTHSMKITGRLCLWLKYHCRAGVGWTWITMFAPSLCDSRSFVSDLWQSRKKSPDILEQCWTFG